MGRDPGEPHRTATSLELLFDLCFVIAVAQASASLSTAVTGGHYITGSLRFALVFFTIWWAWMNFTWFASAYDPDDVPYRLTVLVQITGSLILAMRRPTGVRGRRPACHHAGIRPTAYGPGRPVVACRAIGPRPHGGRRFASPSE